MRNFKFPDPFRWLCEDHRKGVLVLSLTLCLVLLIVMQILDGPLKNEAAPNGIISYELAKTLSVAQRILSSWSQDAKIHAALSLGIDYLFLSVYTLFIGLACVQLGRRFRLRLPKMEMVGFMLAWGQIPAALCDAVENLALFRLLSGSTHEMWPLTAWCCAVIKFTLVGMGWLYILCGSHLLRELVFIIDSNQYRWTLNMKRLLQQTCRTVAEREEKCLTDKEYANLQKRYRNILTRGGKELPEIPLRPKGKRGRIAKFDAHNLWERLKKHETAVLLFAKESYVPFTNNRAERDLRMAKVKQKVSGCFRKERYANAYCRISSYLQTMANLGVNPPCSNSVSFAQN
ncbi:MAG: transposase [Desulfobulbaceae bacterium]|nr:transposase [Desulfobulbaceae bacterium]